MAEYIEREAVKAAVKKRLGTTDLFESRFNADIDAIPTADVAPVVNGTWKRMKAYGTQYVCSECGDMWPDFRSNYCPNCGAHMKEGDINEG